MPRIPSHRSGHGRKEKCRPLPTRPWPCSRSAPQALGGGESGSADLLPSPRHGYSALLVEWMSMSRCGGTSPSRSMLFSTLLLGHACRILDQSLAHLTQFLWALLAVIGHTTVVMPFLYVSHKPLVQRTELARVAHTHRDAADLQLGWILTRLGFRRHIAGGCANGTRYLFRLRVVGSSSCRRRTGPASGLPVQPAASHGPCGS